MTEKFTPGEWDWFISDNGDGFPIIYSGDTDIAEVYLPNGNSEQMLNNAALISAAPKMYNRLKEVKSDFRALLFNPYISEHTKECIKIMIDHIEDDLKKARGEE